MFIESDLIVNSLDQLSNPQSRIGRVFNNNKVKQAVSRLTNPSDLASTCLLESTVLIGRSTQSYKRGGIIELKERVFEELATSAIWLFGVKTFSKIISKGIKKVANIDINTDMLPSKLTQKTGFLASKRPDPLTKLTSGSGKNYAKTIAGLKFGNILVSSVAAIYLVSTVIPKVNQARTKRLLEQEKQKKANKINGSKANNETTNNKQQTTSTQNVQQPNKTTDPKFKGGLDVVKSLAYNQENNDIYKMLTVDTGVTGGRALHARNKDEEIEILIRDVGSLPFYMATTPLILNGLAKHFNPKLNINTSLDADAAGVFSSEVNKLAQQTNSINSLRQNILGNTYSKESITNLKKNIGDSKEINWQTFAKASETSNINNKELNKIKNNFNKFANLNSQSYICDDLIDLANKTKDNSLMDKAKNFYKRTFSGETIKTEDFKEAIPKKLKNKVDLEKTIVDNNMKNAFITKQQIRNVVEGGLINDPEFIGKTLSKATNITNPHSFVKKDDIKSIKKEMKDYAQKVIKDIENKSNLDEKLDQNIVQKSLTRMKNANMLMKTAYFGAGFAVSALFLSTLVPKFQCYVTKLRTGKNEFPGVEGQETQKA